MPHVSQRPFGSFVLAVAAVVAGIVGLTASAGVVDSMLLAGIVAVAAAALTVRRLTRPDARAVIDGAPRGHRLAFVAGAVLLLVQLVPLTAFIIDPTVATWRSAPWTPMPSQHACSTAYWTACEAAAGRASLYAEDLSSVPQRVPTAPRVPRPMGPLSIDPYEYPPSFLPVPALLQRITGDYWGFRRFWFASTLGIVAVVAVLLARRLDRRPGAHALWLTPYLLTAPTMIATLQIGNVQLATIAAWRAAAWTTAWAAAFALASLALYGTTPWIEFLGEMPALLSGEAFAAFRNPNAIANNQSVPGLVFKLKLAGVPHLDYAAMRALGWAYTAAILAVTAWLALRARPQGREPLAWLAILFLATMRSPFLPTYAAFPTLWLGPLVLATSGGRPAVARATVAIVALVSLSWGIGFMPPLVNASWTTLQTIAAFGLVAITCLALRDPATSPAPLSAAPERVTA
jgi:alpha-1,2-mannosyltransferase